MKWLMVETLSGHKYTIGYFSLAMVQGTDLKVLRMSAVAPTADNIHSGRYPYAGPFAFVWKGELQGLAKRFVEFTKSPAGKQIIREFRVIPSSD